MSILETSCLDNSRVCWLKGEEILLQWESSEWVSHELAILDEFNLNAKDRDLAVKACLRLMREEGLIKR